jgi:hypothetical protein
MKYGNAYVENAAKLFEALGHKYLHNVCYEMMTDGVVRKVTINLRDGVGLMSGNDGYIDLTLTARDIGRIDAYRAANIATILGAAAAIAQHINEHKVLPAELPEIL